MIKAIKTDYLIEHNSNLRVVDAPTVPPVDTDLVKFFSKKELKKELKKLRKEIGKLQYRLFAEDKNSLLLVFQAMDAAGKDSTIRSVLSGVNPAGCHVSSFKKPSAEELDHDYLWRSAIRLPERGRIGVFNRSYYEEALVVRVHPNYLQYQRLADLPDDLSEKGLVRGRVEESIYIGTDTRFIIRLNDNTSVTVREQNLENNQANIYQRGDEVGLDWDISHALVLTE